MGMFANPLSHAGYPPGVTGTPTTQPSEVRAATAAEVAAGTLNNCYVSPATANSTIALDFASPPIIGSTAPNVVHATDLYANLTQHGVLLGEGTNAKIVAAAVGTTGQVLTGTSAADPAFAAIGTNSGLTAHGVLIAENNSAFAATAAGSANQVLQSGGASADPVWSTATYPATTTINQLLYSSSANVVGGLATANNGVVATNTTGVPVVTALGQGQTLVGQGASATPAAVSFSNSQITYVPKFDSIPIMSLSTGGTAVVTINNTNLWSFPQWGAYFEAYNTVALQIIAPSLSTTAGRGLNIDTATGANAAAMEITEGNSVNSKNAFVIGTSPAFYVKATFNIATLNTIADVFVGFRKQQAPYQATVPTGYSDYAVIGMHSTLGEIEMQTQVGSGGNVLTDSTQNIAAATNFTVEVDVSATGLISYKINGSAPATSPTPISFTNALTVVPWIYFKSAAGAHGEMDLVSYSCGFQ
jgi:hypothetical protein